MKSQFYFYSPLLGADKLWYLICYDDPVQNYFSRLYSDELNLCDYKTIIAVTQSPLRLIIIKLIDYHATSYELI